MEFSPFNEIVKLCLQGIAFEEKGRPEEAGKIFFQAWNETTNDFEKFLAAYFVARHQINIKIRFEYLTGVQALKKYFATPLHSYVLNHCRDSYVRTAFW